MQKDYDHILNRVVNAEQDATNIEQELNEKYSKIFDELSVKCEDTVGHIKHKYKRAKDDIAYLTSELEKYTMGNANMAKINALVKRSCDEKDG